jgi:rubrerythrin
MPTDIHVVKKALYNEVRSQAFYRLAAELTDRDDTRMLFVELGELEQDHARQIAARIARPPLSLDFDARAYIDELEANVTVMVPPGDAATVRSGDVKAVLKLAKRLEVESRDAYRDLAKRTDRPALRAFCEELARLEEGHLEEIRRLERSLDMPEEERPAL